MEPQLLTSLYATASGERYENSDHQGREENSWKWMKEIKMEDHGRSSPPSIRLCLGIGGASKSNSCSSKSETEHNRSRSSGGAGAVMMELKRKSEVMQRQVAFTSAQLEELHLQFLVFKYLLAGLPLPLFLLLPLFKSPFPPPSHTISIGPSVWSFDHRYFMDPEPGRCRRTDGKKWRCSRDVIPNEKYCERHMHRGCRRSRKLVEASETATKPNTATLINLNSAENSSVKLSNRAPLSLQLKIQPPGDTSARNNSMEKSVIVKVDNISADNQGKNNAATKFVIRASTSANTIAKSNSDGYQNHAGNDHRSLDEVLWGKVSSQGTDENSRSPVITVSSGLDFSPKSVLQGDSSCPNIDQISGVESEPGRCRRTDGKKWRCKKDVIPAHKYCLQHIHRGAKKRVPPSQESGAAIASASATARTTAFTTAARANKCMPLDRNVNISIPRIPAGITNNEENSGSPSGSASTTETTITDNSTDVSNLSPIT
ncbi:hypothetical protein Ancab_037131 [Ancistrocladus abbreviatus]